MKKMNRIRFALLFVLTLVLIFSNCCKKDDKTDKPVQLTIGQNYQGGKIVYILQPGDPGYDANKQHGLIIPTVDQSSMILWYNGSFTSTGATATEIGTGKTNTETIVASQGEGLYAARICYDLVYGGYSDWYLPSLGELLKIYENRVALAIPTENEYWSSSEISSVSAWSLYFGIGSTLPTGKDFPDKVRAVRSF